ncbi:DUF302 domain-containing protein [Kiloniella majae]|uniref:DUF302 domain-containing protein n=1 Tax=Kiloniella majae TaxID=1938558 RepID=UPI000A2795B8|nr:DUF302 domain-containing protein [Kiloniella majae]
MIRRRYGLIGFILKSLPLFTMVLFGSVVSPSLFMPGAQADQGYPYEGVVVMKTEKSFKALTDDLTDSIKANKMGLVTRASASGGAAKAGITIPGNMVVGVYRNDFARRMLTASIPAGIEAPIRFYLTESSDGTSVLTYRKPTAVFAPYNSADLDVMAKELDGIFEAIAKGATQ